MNLTAIDFFGKVVWTGGSDQERAERLRAYEATGMEPEEIAEMKNAGHEAGRRLTMADLIDRSQFDEYNGTVPEGMDVGSYIAGARAVFEAIHKLKAVDAVEVVRCKDCEFAKIEDGFPRPRCCAIYNAAFPANGFCNLGVKKNDETKTRR